MEAQMPSAGLRDASVSDMERKPRSRSGADSSALNRVELLRNRRVLMCPWNALAMLLYYKWHVLKEPPPDFTSDSWMYEPLFNSSNAGLRDDYLLQYCNELYYEYMQAISRGSQTCKYMSNSAFSILSDILESSLPHRNTVASAKNMYVTRKILQNELFDDIQMANAGFKVDARGGEAYKITRNAFPIYDELIESIFPFADDFLEDNISKDKHDGVINFCNLLKVLRETLVQDMGLFSVSPFYRRMFVGNPILYSEPLQSPAFTKFLDDVLHKSWNTAEFNGLIGETPKDFGLSKVIPYECILGATRFTRGIGPMTPVAAMGTQKRLHMESPARSACDAEMQTPTKKRQRIIMGNDLLLFDGPAPIYEAERAAEPEGTRLEIADDGNAAATSGGADAAAAIDGVATANSARNAGDAADVEKDMEATTEESTEVNVEVGIQCASKEGSDNGSTTIGGRSDDEATPVGEWLEPKAPTPVVDNTRLLAGIHDLCNVLSSVVESNKSIGRKLDRIVKRQSNIEELEQIFQKSDAPDGNDDAHDLILHERARDEQLNQLLLLSKTILRVSQLAKDNEAHIDQVSRSAKQLFEEASDSFK
ncbi:hypothetical protein GGI12_000214 [Dipsacomyces acuminosporus]|nr:hypothetical protein GGI12_000214 [Dipsacomyces acuminosporus]